MRRLALTLIVLLHVTLYFCYGQITIAAAANVQYALEDIKVAFEKETHTTIKTIFGASGKLAFQIKNGAPFDVFISADMDYPDSLVKWGYAQGKPKIYVYGKLVLWSLKDVDVSQGLAILTDPKVTKIALPDPKRAPYGREAVKAMQHDSLFAKVTEKLIYCESISQASQYILTQNVDIGFCAKSVVLAKNMEGKGKWAEVDSSSYNKIAQGGVICKYGSDNNPNLSQKFMDYLYSAKARDIFSKYGYILP